MEINIDTANNSESNNSEPSLNPEKPGVWSVSFIAMLFTQFLGAFNDNMFRFLMIPIGIFALQDYLIGLEELPSWAAYVGITSSDPQALQELAQKTILFIGAELFLIPFVLMVGPAGFLSDRFRKDQVMVGTKIAEIVIMGLGVLALMSGSVWFLLIVLFFMGTQSTLFSPAKYGSIPEIVPPEQIPTANSLVSMTTVAACIFGTVCGGILFELTSVIDKSGSIPTCAQPGQSRVWISACALLGTACLGLIASLFIKPLKKGNPEVKYPYNPLSGIVSDMKFLYSWRAIWAVTFASAFYWGIAALLQLNIDKYIFPEFASIDNRFAANLCMGLMTIGIGVGAGLASVISGGKITMKLPTFAVLGLAACCVALCYSPGVNSNGYYFALGLLALLGFFAGMYDIPLMSFIQDRSPAEHRGRIIASSNFISNSAMLLAPIIFFALTVFCGQTARSVWFWCGLASLPVFVILFFFAYIKQCAYWIFWIYFRLRYKIEIVGAENIPKDRAIMYVSNHISFLDGPLGEIFWPGSPRMVMWYKFLEGPLMKHLGELYKAIPISTGREGVYALRTVRQALQDGENVGIFPEGGIARWAVIQPFHPGAVKMLKGTNAVVVPVYIGGLWGSVFSYYGQKFFWKIPTFCRKRITIIFGEPLENVTNRFQLYQTIKRLENRWFEMEHEREVAQFDANHPNHCKGY